MKKQNFWKQRGIRLVASLSLIGLAAWQLPIGALFGTPALGQGQAVYTDPDPDPGSDFLGISGLSNGDVAQAGVVGLVVYGTAAALAGGAGEAAAAAAAAGALGTGAAAAPAILATGDTSEPIWNTLNDDNGNRFSRFVSAAEVNGIKETPLRDTKNGPYTTFAPTDAALIALANSETTGLASATEQFANQKTLLKHVVVGKYNIKDLEALESGFPLATVSGETLTVTKNGNGTVNVDGIPVVREDIKASNGVSHPINQILR